MAKESGYFLVIYPSVPDVDFICDCRGDVRIRVSRTEKKNFYHLSVNFLYGIVEKFVFVFENISDSAIRSEEMIAAVNWYKNKIGHSGMEIVSFNLVSN